MDNNGKDNYLSNADTFYNASSDDGFDVSQSLDDSGLDLSNISPERLEQLQQEWKQELAKTEEEIQTLRQVLSSKLKHSHELKRKLGITVWKEFREDMEQGIKNIQETTASGLGTFSYQKTTEVLKGAGEKTTSVFGSLGGSVARKLGEVKNSNAFKSFEERVGTVASSVKSKISTSRSNSTNSFEEALNSTERKSSISATSPITSAPIPEDNPLS